ncbi:hypothetical protein [Pectinatus frisingensis]|uniref:hypothetical protein n=1 Tax=Pectinatus frisingensis TaxID=865 RepID=UPI0018C657D2|nr:hypothetical protein [Pectinatus frisingensis]
MLDYIKRYCLQIHAIGFVLFIIFLFTMIYNINHGWSYFFFDLIIKLVSGIGTIIAAVFIYIKWKDEKTRKLYEQRLQDVYAPLMTLVIRQEEYRKIDSPDLDRNRFPILTEIITKYSQNMKFSSKGVSITNSETKKLPGLVSRERFVEILDEKKYGLCRPQLLLYITNYKLILEIEEIKKKNLENKYPEFMHEKDFPKRDEIERSLQGRELSIVLKRRCQIECLLINEIISGYNNCIEKLELDSNYMYLEDSSLSCKKI